MKRKKTMSDQESFAVIGATIVDNFGIELPRELIGTSILKATEAYCKEKPERI